MDGTLLNQQKQITDRCLKAMKKARQQGKYVVIATGRSLSELTEYEQQFEDVSYVIAESGAVVYDYQQKQILNTATIAPEILDEIAMVSQKQDIMPQMFIQGQTYCGAEQKHRIKDYGMGEYQSLFDHASLPVDDVKEFLQIHRADMEKINLYHRSAEERFQTLQEVQHLNVERVFAEATSIEFSPKGVHKGTGLQFLCDLLSLDLAQTIAVGDNYNDSEILKLSGMAIAMKNSNPDILAMADHIVSDNDHDGCAEAIEQYLL